MAAQPRSSALRAPARPRRCCAEPAAAVAARMRSRGHPRRDLHGRGGPVARRRLVDALAAVGVSGVEDIAGRITVACAQQVCLAVLEAPEARAATGRTPRVLAPFEYNFFLEDMKTLGTPARRLRSELSHIRSNGAHLPPRTNGPWARRRTCWIWPIGLLDVRTPCWKTRWLPLRALPAKQRGADARQQFAAGARRRLPEPFRSSADLPVPARPATSSSSPATPTRPCASPRVSPTPRVSPPSTRCVGT